MTKSRMIRSAMLAAGTMFVFASVAQAQVCAGFPTHAGQGSVGALANFPEGLNQYGAQLSYNLPAPVSVNASFVRTTADVDDAEGVNTFGAGVAYKATAALHRPTTYYNEHVGMRVKRTAWRSPARQATPNACASSARANPRPRC
jgi:hypothetical protein